MKFHCHMNDLKTKNFYTITSHAIEEFKTKMSAPMRYVFYKHRLVLRVVTARCRTKRNDIHTTGLELKESTGNDGFPSNSQKLDDERNKSETDTRSTDTAEHEKQSVSAVVNDSLDVVKQNSDSIKMRDQKSDVFNKEIFLDMNKGNESLKINTKVIERPATWRQAVDFEKSVAYKTDKRTKDIMTKESNSRSSAQDKNLSQEVEKIKLMVRGFNSDLNDSVKVGSGDKETRNYERSVSSQKQKDHSSMTFRETTPESPQESKFRKEELRLLLRSEHIMKEMEHRQQEGLGNTEGEKKKSIEKPVFRSRAYEIAEQLRNEKNIKVSENVGLEHDEKGDIRHLLSEEKDSKQQRKSDFKGKKSLNVENLTKNEFDESEIHIHGKSKALLKRDSRGLLILTDQVPNFENKDISKVVDLLVEQIIYDQDDIVAINKPYGLVSQGSGSKLDIANLLKPLAKKLDHQQDTLHFIHRLDKETTGVMLLARTKTMADKLRAVFKERTVVKKYWTITKGVPDPLTGLVDIPLGEGTVRGKIRMVALPERADEIKDVIYQPRKHRKESVTKYTVMQHQNNCAFLECTTLTGTKHQIRAHLFYGLNTPILGDHKYSHLQKLAPQELPTDMLKSLQISETKVRHLPMHLHSRILIIPNFIDNKHVFVRAPLPRHFTENGAKLGFKMPINES